VLGGRRIPDPDAGSPAAEASHSAKARRRGNNNEDAARGAEELLITEGVTDCISAMQWAAR
jgi:hypothetical protein